MKDIKLIVLMLAVAILLASCDDWPIIDVFDSPVITCDDCRK